MNKELTEQQVRQLVFEITTSEQAKQQMEFEKAQIEMRLAEEVLANSLTKEQRVRQQPRYLQPKKLKSAFSV